ncbi:PE family protein [Mycobacterium paragordonae]|uniref:PE family protein n=1 Tax=Mycobacterium paragordonae TaxID=1389713 RepID=UPI0012E237D9|nr:PE family protein [Mycobacterium paragordonae]
MSFVFAAPELVEAAAQNLTGISSALGQATTAAAGPTTAVLAAGADEVSAAIAQLFGAHGQEFQAISAQAAAFHDEFVGLLNAGAGAYASAEAAGAQTLSGTGLVGFADAVAAPYQALAANTAANLQALSGALAAHPAPVLTQLASNLSGYGPQIATGFANAPASIEAGLNALSTANPLATLQGIVNQQIGFGQVVASSLQHAGNDLVAGFSALPSSFQAASQAFAAGDVTGGLQLIGGGFLNPFFSGFNTVTGADAVITVTPTGALGDLFPIVAIPGQMAQNFTDLLPVGSVPAQVAQHFTNLVNTLTDTGVTSTVGLIVDPNGPFGLGVTIDAHMGLPLTLAIEALGAPANGLNALGVSATTFAGAVQSGDVLGAASTVLGAPAAFADGFLNGQMSLPITIEALGAPTTLNLPLSGLLVPAAPYTAVVDAAELLGVPGLTFNSTVTGTPIGGLIPGLLDFLPQSLAAALGAPAPVIPPLVVG